MIKHPPLYDAGGGILHSQNRAAKVLQISRIYKYLLDFFVSILFFDKLILLSKEGTMSKMYNFFKLRKSLRIKISSTITITDEHISRLFIHVV